MTKQQQMITNLKTYIKNVIDADIDVKEISNANRLHLPFFLTNSYGLYSTRIFNRKIVLMFAETKDTTVDRIRNHVEQVRLAYNKVVVVVIENIESYTRKRLIEKRVSFIVPGKQMFLPDLLIDLKEFANVQEVPGNVIQPAAQFLLLYHILVDTLENKNMKTIAENLTLMPMTITRAAYNLHNTGLCKIVGTKDKFLVFNGDKKELWEKAIPLMSSPIKHVSYYSGTINDRNHRRSNMNALAHYTDINYEPLEYYAVKAVDIHNLLGIGLKQTGKIVGNICIEGWRYNPGILSGNSEYVDPLSLYLCFKDEKDERIQSAIEQLLEQVQW